MIIKKYRVGRKSPFQVLWREQGKRYSRFFFTESERDLFIEKLSALNGGLQSVLKHWSNESVREHLQFEAERKDVPISAIWDFWKRNHKEVELITVWTACNNYILDMKAQNREITHIKRVSRILELFCETYEHSFVEHITRQNLENWIKNLPHGGQTKENYKAIIRTAWGFFEAKNWVSKNVADKLKTEKVIQGEIGILTVDETEKLLRANEHIDPEICGLMALGLFAGMRSSAISRVDYNEIKFDMKSIITPAEKTKLKRRNVLENLPNNLWAWLERTPQSAFDMTERNFKKRREVAYRRAGLLINAQDVKRLASQGIEAEIKLPVHNAFRHSFVSYHVALHRNFTDTQPSSYHTEAQISSLNTT